MQACKYGHLACVRVLLTEKDIKVDAIDANGKTARTLAALNGHNEIVQLLGVLTKHNDNVSATHSLSVC
jgi:ankyrin repeat protein